MSVPQERFAHCCESARAETPAPLSGISGILTSILNNRLRPSDSSDRILVSSCIYHYQPLLLVNCTTDGLSLSAVTPPGHSILKQICPDSNNQEMTSGLIKHTIRTVQCCQGTAAPSAALGSPSSGTFRTSKGYTTRLGPSGFGWVGFGVEFIFVLGVEVRMTAT